MRKQGSYTHLWSLQTRSLQIGAATKKIIYFSKISSALKLLEW